MTTTECPRSYDDCVEAAERVYRALKLLRGLVQDGGMPRYSVTPGAALNSVIEEDVDPALMFAARNLASLRRLAPLPYNDGVEAADNNAALEEIIGHLGAALIQQAPSDDKIIMGHVRDAYVLACRARGFQPKDAR